MQINSTIRTLRIVSLLLFITPAIALLGSLLLHNSLIKFNFVHEPNYNFTENTPGISKKFYCSLENNYCSQLTGSIEKVDKLNKCNKYETSAKFVSENDDVINLSPENFKKEIQELDQKVFRKYEILNKLNTNCILNTKFNSYYNIAPFLFEAIFKIKNHDKTELGTGATVNPIIYGETSISNIVKRFPVSYFFKPIIYLSVILMIWYWLYYNKILNYLFNEQKKNYFLVFGILSGIFLLLHTFFLGWTFESEILTKLRRTLVIFFILFEVLAQAFLIKCIFQKKDELSKYLNYVVIYLKLIFVILVCFVSILILTLLIFYNFDAKIDYILEWNYFLVLLLFYFLSFMIWKKTSF